MTWADTIATGDSTGLNFRLVVEGWQDAWVTDAGITGGTSGTAGGRKNRPGLEYTGLKISEQAVLRDAWVTVKGITFNINPTGEGSGAGADEETLSSFTRTPTPIGYLKTPLTTGGSKIYLSNGVVFPAGTNLHLASEACRVLSTGSDGGGAFMTVGRAWFDSANQNHLLTYGPALAVNVPIYLYPPTMEGRRCYLFAYGTGDSLSGVGTLIWKGIVSRPPKMSSDGIGWVIQSDSIVKSLEQKVAAASGLEYKIRGIYHSDNAPFNLQAYYLYIGASASSSYKSTLLQLTGFFESQDLWVNEVNTQIELSSFASTDTEIRQLVYEERGPSPTMHMTINSITDLKNIAVWAGSVLEGDLQVLESVVSERFSGASYKIGDPFVMDPDVGWDHYFGDGSQEFMVYGYADDNPRSPASQLSYPLPATRAVAGYPNRALKGYNFYADVYGSSGGTSSPPNRIFLNSVEALVVGETLAIINGDAAVMIRITFIQPAAGARYIDFEFTGGDTVVYLTDATRIVPMRVFARNGNLDDFCAGLINASPNGNDGDTPYIPQTDLDHSALTLAYGGFASIDDFWQHRNYAFLKPTPVKTILAEELKAIGWMMRLDYLATPAFCQLPLVSGTAEAVAIITDADLLLPSGKSAGMWPMWEAQNEGIVNTVNARFGYRPIEDDFDPAKDYTQREINSIAEHKSNGKGSAEIAPRSTPARVPQITLRINQGNGNFARFITVGGGEFATATPQQIGSWISNYMRVLSMDYAVVTIAVPFKFFALQIADIIEVTSAFIPNGLGTRGVTSAKAAIVGREWDFDPRSGSPMGKLTLYFPRQISGGYTPSGRIGSQSNLGGNNWRLIFGGADVRNLRWSSDGTGNVVKNFAIGDAIQIVQVDSASPTTLQGTISALNTGSGAIDVALTGAWTPGSSAWNLLFNNDSLANARQHQFVFIANSSSTLASGEFARQLL